MAQRDLAGRVAVLWRPGDSETALREIDYGWRADRVLRGAILSPVIGGLAAELMRTPARASLSPTAGARKTASAPSESSFRSSGRSRNPSRGRVLFRTPP